MVKKDTCFPTAYASSGNTISTCLEPPGAKTWVPSILSTKRSDSFLTTQCLPMLSANVLNVSFAFQFSTHPKHTKSPSELLINKR